jgi:hypothetical protein
MTEVRRRMTENKGIRKSECGSRKKAKPMGPGNKLIEK